ncbi:MAG TPA: hypothetical protein VGK09_06070 [Rhodocyclaceae bacterium]|jgi:hypothetical protein
MMSPLTTQDAQIFKERCEDSPGILMLCQGDWQPTAERLRLLEEQNYYVMTAANGYQDILDWLPQPRCIGAMFAHPETVAQARQHFPEKVIERFEGVGARFLRSLTQELPYGLHNAGAPFTATAPAALKTLDVVSVFSPVALKRGHLLIEALLAAGVTAYVFAQSLGSNPQLLASFFDVVKASGKTIEYFHYPFDPYALMRIDGRIVIDGRPIGANNSIVSAYLARARLFVHTSTTEGISNSIMEALLNDVPVLICDDIRGPQQALSLQLPQCIHRSPPDTASLAGNIRDLLASPRTDGEIRAAFRQVIDPFEINRRVVRGTQEWFTRNGLPWKGHCLGLLGGVQSKIDLASVSAEESYRGGRHIYPSVAEATQCVGFQWKIADSLGRSDHAASLLAELQYISDNLAAKPAQKTDQDSPEGQVDISTLHRLIAILAEKTEIKHVLEIGAAADLKLTDILVEHLGRNEKQPQLYCLEMAESAHAALVQRYGDKGFVHCLQASTVPLEAFPSEEDVAHFYQNTPDRLKGYPLETILQWLRNDVAQMRQTSIESNGIRSAQGKAGVDNFDMVFIDGREFTGFAEMALLKGANILILGCTRTFKNQQSLKDLSQDPEYDLLFSAPELGNGYAGFVKKLFREQGGLSRA